MDTKQILTFITLAETSNYIKAADRLNYAPSTLAKHIRCLEEELGTKLVEHRDNRIRLTLEGERFCGYAQKLLETYWEAMEKVADGKATKIIIPSEIQGLAGLAASAKALLETDPPAGS